MENDVMSARMVVHINLHGMVECGSNFELRVMIFGMFLAKVAISFSDRVCHRSCLDRNQKLNFLTR